MGIGSTLSVAGDLNASVVRRNVVVFVTMGKLRGRRRSHDAARSRMYVTRVHMPLEYTFVEAIQTSTPLAKLIPLRAQAPSTRSG